jgi:hypothetical protein
MCKTRDPNQSRPAPLRAQKYFSWRFSATTTKKTQRRLSPGRTGPPVLKREQPRQSPRLKYAARLALTNSTKPLHSLLSAHSSRLPSHWANGRNRPTNLSYHHTTPLPLSGSRALPCLAEPKQSNNCLAWRQWRGSDH